MKRIVILSLLVLATLALQAQTGLRIMPLFEGKIIPQERLVETRVRGKMLIEYRLSFFHSISFSGTKEEAQRVYSLMKEENVFVSEYQDKKVRTMLMQLPRHEEKNRFLCYKSRQKGERCEVTVIYMEGMLTSLKELNKILNMK